MQRTKRRNARNGRDRAAGERAKERPDTMGTNVYSAKDHQSLHKSLNGEFFLYQILLQQLVDGNDDLPQSVRQGLRKYFDPTDAKDREVMKEFDKTYVRDKAIHWYTRETCIYRILNKSLRTQNIDDVAPFGQLIRDIQQQLAEEQVKFVREQKSPLITAYRGQLISKDEVSRLKTARGELISMNSFLSTSTNRDKALEFARSRKPPTDELTNILLEISVNFRNASKPFADIQHLSAFAEEAEILFMFGAVFRIDDISFDEKDQLWKAKFTLCGDNDEDMKKFKSTLKEEMDGKHPLIAIGKYLVQMQKYEDAEDHFLQMIDENVLKNPFDLADCHLNLAQVWNLKANHSSAIEHLQHAMDLLKKHSPKEDHPLISQCYNEWASISAHQGQYPQAFQLYEKALKTPNNQRAVTYLGISKIHSSMGNYQLALDNLDRAEEKLTKEDFTTRSTISLERGKVYILMDDKERSTKEYDQAIKSQRDTLGENHPDLGYTYSVLASMYSKSNDYDKALEFIDKSYQLQLGTLPGNHQDFGQTFEDFADIYCQQNDYDRALQFYQQSIDNRLTTVLPSHPTISKLQNRMGEIHRMRKNYPQALDCFHKVLQADLERKKFGDPTLTPSFRQVADVYDEQGDRDSALQFYQKTLENELETKFAADSSLIDLYRKLARGFYGKRALAEALFYTNRRLDCLLKKQPNDQEAIDDVYQSIGKIYLKKNRSDQSLLMSRNPTRIVEENTNRSSALGQGETGRGKHFRRIDEHHFDERHLNQAQMYFQRRLKKQLKSDQKDPQSLADLNQILENLAAERN